MESPVEEGTVGQLVGALQKGREKRRGSDGGAVKGEVVETEAERRIRERVGRGKS